MEKQYDHQTEQSRIRKLWEEQKTYQFNPGGQLFSIDTPPPTVSGNLHIGHIFSYTQTDIIARYKRMQGFNVFYPFGFDDNGLPTERYVEKKRDIAAWKMSRSEFIKICLEETLTVEEQFKALWQRIGLSVDWEYLYSTISDSTRKISQEFFIELYKKGFAYRKNEPALYCTLCRTSVAQAELDDVEKPSTFNDVVFKDTDGNELIVATTRPELLPSDVALLYHPNDIRYQHLYGRRAIVPIFGQEIPILPDDTVIKEKGSGLVMVSTFGDKMDIAWFKKHKLPYRPMIGLDGKFLESAGILAGLTVPVAREKVIEELKKIDALRNQQSIMHAVNVHERCKREIEYVMLPQWFLNILSYKKELIAAADSVEWYPAHMKIRYVNWVENLSWDWGLSRQRFFGIPFPTWHCTKCGHVILADIKQLPIDPQETPYNGSCPQCKSDEIVPDKDVMDTWNTSSLTPYLCYALYAKTTDNVFQKAVDDKFIPMSMRPQAHDIIRTWAFDTIVKVWMHNNDIPWRSIVISGHVLAAAKEKISKSKENAKSSPEAILDQYNADAVRYWTASGALGTDITFSEDQIKIGQRLITKLWNAFRFIDEHKEAVDNVTAEIKGVLNQWLLHRATETFTGYKEAFDRNEFGLALDRIEKFFWHDFCDNYLEIVKDQLFHPEQYDAHAVQLTKQTLYVMGLRILQLYAPYLPFVTETLYQDIYRSTVGTPSLHQTKFGKVQTSFVYKQSIDIMQILLAIIAQARRLKTEKQLSLKTPLKELHVYLPANDLDQELIKAQEQLIKGVCQAEKVTFAMSEGPKSELVASGDLWIAHINLNDMALP